MQEQMLQDPATSFAKLTFNKFNSLPKTGKPTKSEWTVLSSIIQVDSTNGDSKVVALGSGTKCIGKSKLCPSGLILNDSHAEVLARRAFLRYIYHQLKTKSDIFVFDEKSCLFRRKESISFHFFSTQVPCGDACIVSEPIENQADEIPKKRIKLDNDSNDFGNVLPSATVFTGAKLIGQEDLDPMLQVQGCLRTKPGRGDRTLSMSCSDKLSKWNIIGIQGALLDIFLEKPVYMESLNFSCNFDMDSMIRAIYGRWKEREFKSTRYLAQKPLIQLSTECNFEFSQDPDKNASPNSLVWCDVPHDKIPYEISVNGKKQGITKKQLNSKKSSLKVSKLHLFEEFCEFLKSNPHFMIKLNLKDDDLDKITYKELKQMCQPYTQSWRDLKESYLQQWTVKPDKLLDFNLSSSIKKS